MYYMYNSVKETLGFSMFIEMTITQWGIRLCPHLTRLVRYRLTLPTYSAPPTAFTIHIAIRT